MAAAEESAEKPAAAPAEAPSSGGGSKLVLILTLVNMVATLGMVAVLMISFKRDRAKANVGDIVAQSEEHGEDKGKESEHGGGGEHGGGEHGGKSEGKKPVRDFGKIVTLEQFTVNLSTAGTVNPKFARVAISLEVPSDDLEGEVNQRMAQVRNTIIDLFNSKKPADLGTTDGRNYLKDEIKSALNSFLVTGKVKGVFFTNFALSG